MACRHQSRRGSDPLRRWGKRRCERNRSDFTHVAANRAEVRQCQVAVTLRGSRSLRIGSPAVLPPSGCALTNDASVQCAGQFGVMGKAALHRSRGKMTPVVMRGSTLYIPGVWLEHVVPRQRASELSEVMPTLGVETDTPSATSRSRPFRVPVYRSVTVPERLTKAACCGSYRC
jgi:hypothetical protein